MAIFLVISISACKSPTEKKQEELAKSTEAAKRAAYQAELEYELMLRYFERYDELQEKINSLPKGSFEYELAVEESNQLVREMIAKYPDLEQYVYKIP